MAVKRISSQQSSSKKQHSAGIPVASKGDPADPRYAPVHAPWAPSPGLAFKLLMSARLCAALWSLVSDCDETYNYWEPAHYLLYGKGFQTWEYSPVYAIRSYAYILLHVLPMKLLAAVFGSEEKILLFYMMRCVLGLACAASEMVFYRGVMATFGPNVARLTLVFQLFAAGMFVSASAFLPSSFSMYLTMLAYGAWMTRKHNFAILSIAASAILGWPFAAALGIPIAVDVFLLKRRGIYFIKWCCISLVLFLLPTILVDCHYYGKLVVTPLNIVLYNVFTGHGPELYGTEPVSYYLINGFLNYNFAFLLALGALPVLMFLSLFITSSSSKRITLLLCLSPMYIWILIFFTRPHKEERFLFPIYPFFSMAAALVLDGVQRLVQLMLSGRSDLSGRHNNNWLSILFSTGFICLALSRSLALRQGYHAALSIYVDLNTVASDPELFTPPPQDAFVNVCVGKEWYRFPSSFFLPNNQWQLKFLRSEFRGLLPAPYFEEPGGTKIVPAYMNDMNREEPTRYSNISECQFLIDRDSEDWTALEPRFSEKSEWTVLKQRPFLDSARSHSLFRAFYVPYLSESKCHFTSYNLLKTKHVQNNTPASKKKIKV